MTFLEEIKSGCIRAREKYGILASVSAAQAALESGWGTSKLATEGKNLFGIKSSGDWTGRTVAMPTKEWDGSKYIEIMATWRAYDSWADSVEDHGAFFVNTPWRKDHYASVIAGKTYQEQCRALQACGYATAPTYAASLIRVIEDNKLYEWDGQKGDQETMAVDIEKAIRHMEWLKSKGVKYSMYGSRIGTDGTADCSGAIYSALRQGGATNAGWILNTDSMHAWLEKNGFKCIATNSNWEAKRGDVVIFGKRGASGGAAGHVVMFINHDQIIHCNYSRNGVTVDSEASTCPYSMGWYVYRYQGPAPKPQAQPQGKPLPVNIKSAHGKVTIRKVATHWLTREKISSSVIGKTFEYDAVCDCNISVSKKAYRLKDGKDYLGWLLEQDVEPEKKPVTAEDREIVINGVKYEVREKK